MKKILSGFVCLILCITLTVTAMGEIPVTDIPFATDYRTDDLNRVFYEIFVGSFSDSDGDGVGDIRGIINRMDYLNDGDPTSGLSLGVEGLWLTPVFMSPSYHKYDVADYYRVDPVFGTNEDLKELLDLCHERNVLVILDLPINHTSVECRWFKNFRNARMMKSTTNEFYDFYSSLPEGASIPADRHFMPVRNTGIRCEANFSDEMPELNFDNPLVREKVLDVARYWLELGVDGFRFDAAKYIYYGDHEASEEFWAWYIGELKKIRPDVYTVAEVWDGEGITDKYVPSMNCFNFAASQGGIIAETAKKGNVNKFTSYVRKTVERLRGIRPDAMNLLFISNHDMDRCAGYLTVSDGFMKMAANLYLLSPGSPFIYYGEEIGLRGSRGSANTDANRRLAMLWGDGDTVKDPEGTTYDPSKQTPYSVADLAEMEEGLYQHYKKVLMVRAANPEIARGTYRDLEFKDSKVGGFVSEWQGSRTAVFHNTTQNSKTVDLTVFPELEGMTVTTVLGDGAKLENGMLTLEGQTSVVMR